MATSLHSTLTDIIDKISALEQTCQQLTDRCADLEKANADLQLQLKEANTALQRSRLEVEHLRVSHRLAADADSIIEARRKISSIIRRIDKAIALATDDPSL